MGHRVGRAWRVDVQSVETLERRRGKTHSGTIAPDAAAAQSQAELASPPAPGSRSVKQRGQPGEWTVRKIEVLAGLVDLAAACGKALPTVEAAEALRQQTLLHAFGAACHGAAGYHAFAGHDKLRLYGKARELSAMAATGLSIIAAAANGKAEGLRLLATSFERTASRLGGLMRRIRRIEA